MYMLENANRYISVYQLHEPGNHVEDIPIPEDMVEVVKELLDPDDEDPQFIRAYIIEKDLGGAIQAIIDRGLDAEMCAYQMEFCER